MGLDPKDKNKAVIEQQQELKAKQDSAAEQEASLEAATPEELRGMLTKRNEDYVFRLEKQLKEAGLTEGDAKLKVNSYLKEIIVAQRKGQPATHLYGSPQVKAQELVDPRSRQADEVKFWQKAVDNSLLYLAIFSAMFGLVGLFSKTQQQIGFITILSVGLLFGFLMTYYNDLIMRKKEDRPSMWKMMLGGIGIVFFIFLWITLTELPFLRVVNPVLPGWGSLVIAVLAYLGRRYFRAHYHITTSSFGPGPGARR
ncbi:hypothetical protein FC62_GL001121 [Amylolactobacillus amylotrophicus DSM 20534]|uniref:Uncharacterized protein n=3 Tax=Amylolactobacillus TaxID=2767876 RepID=A0A0R1YGR2_9LACO|nr:DUF1129 domain-containing protein [Amylolactobacillus amylophilus]APT18650.1 hypothetical protein LA20533_04955 [Amylolactobacillus amylophilus DSM 20533 = JCM 1125]KRK37787.1 hypothetical protein FC62_GL001121 [Amylolactobacillus amylotrophicus DSM 20534]KRM41575.1 hypothetical protein FD40_GL001416 [Amylolactobacillus amylophilus DSM 20533 = JCM 1125]